jgi:hypothetical protein
MKKIIILGSLILVIIVGVVYKFSYTSFWLGNNEIGRDEAGTVEDIFVIETPVNSAAECIGDEEYDKENNVCYIECVNESDCDKVEQELDELLDTLEDDYKEFAQDFEEFEGDTEEEEKAAEIIYNIDQGEKFIISRGIENGNHQKIKKWLALISPDNFSDKHLNRLLIMPSSNDDSAAFVSPSDDSLEKWDIFINMESMEEDGDKEMVFTLIHEFAHILTLNNTQVDKNRAQALCNNYFVEEGCLGSDTYLNIFYNNFWKGKLDNEPEENYFKQPSSFVTEYAATNPEEDIAETFASFVFRKKISAVSSVAEEKVNFFYQFSELENMRESIRNVLKPFVRKRILLKS